MHSEFIEVLVLGGGITGLSAAMKLEDRAVVLEKENVPGGLVRSHQFEKGYWFDHVLHLLHVRDERTQKIIIDLMGGDLKACVPVAWVESLEGTVRYPFQLNLGGLNVEARKKCLADFSEVYFSSGDSDSDFNAASSNPTNSRSNEITNNRSYRSYLKNTFGQGMCDAFYFPYNQKQWMYSIDEIVVEGQSWNIHRPNFDEVLDGVFHPNEFRETYNTHAFYPQPEIDSPLRGMGLLTHKIAKKVNRLDLGSRVLALDPRRKLVSAECKGEMTEYTYEHCLSTLPLPYLMKICKGTPRALLDDVSQLKCNKVLSIALCIKGPRPESPGHWRYYADLNIPFTRLIFMTEFDSHAAPENGWSLLVEIPLSYRTVKFDFETILRNVLRSISELELLTPNDEIIAQYHWLVNYAYVIFTPETKRILDDCHGYLETVGIVSKGRYATWEYSSMYQNIKAGFNYAEKVTQVYDYS